MTPALPDVKLYQAMVAEHVDDPNLWDDCIQEAAIHVWRLRQRGIDHPDSYYRKAARMRIKEVAQRQTWLGHTGKHGVPIDPLRRPHDSLDGIASDENDRSANGVDPSSVLRADLYGNRIN